MNTFELSTMIAVGCTAMDDTEKVKIKKDKYQAVGFRYVDSYEAKARTASRKLCKKQETIKRESDSTTARMFDMLYKDWTDHDFRKMWKKIPFDYQQEYCRRKGIEWTINGR